MARAAGVRVRARAHTYIDHVMLSSQLKGHDHNVSAYSRRSVNAWGVVNFSSTVCTYHPGQSTFPC